MERTLLELVTVFLRFGEQVMIVQGGDSGEACVADDFCVGLWGVVVSTLGAETWEHAERRSVIRQVSSYVRLSVGSLMGRLRVLRLRKIVNIPSSEHRRGKHCLPFP